MGVLLRQVLKTLCGANRWCYAVFWMIGRHNPKLLIWEECYYESESCSETENFGDSEGYWASDTNSSLLRVQTGNMTHLLINKMMMNNQVNVVGQGIVGRAAFMGNHEWILANNCIGDAYPSEVLTEVHQQFSAGMQTIAVIPVSPHGVVQLGSSLIIMENMEFVNNVKSLILQLGCVPGSLMSNNLVAKESPEKTGPQVSLGMPESFSMQLPGNKVPNFTCLLGSSCNQQSISSISSRIGQPSHSQIRLIQNNLQPSASTFHAPNMTKTLPISCGDPCDPKMTSFKPDGPLRGQLQDGVVGAEVISSNVDALMNQHVASFSSRSAFSQQSVIDQSDANNSILTLLEHVISDVSPENHFIVNKNVLGSFITPHVRRKRGLIVNSDGGSLTSGADLHIGAFSHVRPYAIPSPLLDLQKSSMQLAEVDLQNVVPSTSEEVPLSSMGDQLSSSGMFSGSSHHSYHATDAKHAKSELIADKEKMDDDLIQALNISSLQPDEHISFDENIIDSVHNCLKHASGSHAVIANNEHEDSCSQPPSGDDLYDVLGVDFKNRLLRSKWDGLLADGPFANSHIGKDTSTLMDVQEANIDIFSVNLGISDNSIFSGMDTDHLLDAVVSRAHSTVKQNSDDDISCKTTLTKISSSSVPSGSPTYGLVHVSDQVQKGSLDLRKAVEKSGTIVSGLFRSGCSKDDMGSSSQTTSIYGSRLSSWVGHSMRNNSIVSTAYTRKNDEMTKPNRKRLKPGENPRPRPKDRQMIQDRMKELREIVPNGAKLSIDALLERTIKHMLFLQSVTKHADKLKQMGESKIINVEGGLLLKDNFEGGATWAIEVGSQSMVCPIIVEDLNPTGQMLVEMLCEERGLFLEIADVIRGLGLTILKGLMEARNDKIWAHFAVEANREITRMEVFMSLVHLLEQTVKGGAPSTVAFENDNMIVRHALPQATSISATGRASCLQ